MPNVAAVRLTYNPRVLWFDPNGVEFSAGDALIVKTERGLEYGVADENLKEVSEDAIAKLKSPLKPVMRKATSEDSAKWANLQAQAEEALPVFKEMVEQYKLDMHPVTVEFLFDGDKAIFYFEADERIDFRELVRALAAKFHVRIDMRQIGVRDEARIVGGFGHCGQELCCARLGGRVQSRVNSHGERPGFVVRTLRRSRVCAVASCVAFAMSPIPIRNSSAIAPSRGPW